MLYILKVSFNILFSLYFLMVDCPKQPQEEREILERKRIEIMVARTNQGRTCHGCSGSLNDPKGMVKNEKKKKVRDFVFKIFHIILLLPFILGDSTLILNHQWFKGTHWCATNVRGMIKEGLLCAEGVCQREERDREIERDGGGGGW